MNRRGGRRGGVFGHFVSSSDLSLNRPYRGAEIPPPSTLTSSGRSNLPSASGATFNRVPPSNVSGVNKQGYCTMNTISDATMSYSQYGLPVKRIRTEEEYFNEEDEEEKREREKVLAAERKRKEEEELPYIPAPGSPSAVTSADDDEEKLEENHSDPEKDEDSEEDPLDAFMANLEKDAKEQGVKSSRVAASSASSSSDSSVPSKKKGVRTDIEELDDEESYYKWLEENPNAGRMAVEDDDLEIEYDEDGNPIAPPKSKSIDPLPPIDRSKIDYKPFEKHFYREHPDIMGLSPIQVIDLQQKLGIHVSGPSQPKPVSSFAHFGFDEALLSAIRRSEFTTPTPIQAMAIPALLSGRDVIGIAKTGSGKTAAFLWPMLVHIMDQPSLKKGEGPIGLVLVPTRELAMQIYSEAKKFGKVYNIQVVCAYGGGSKWEQSKAFEAGAEIAIATPGRMIDMIKMKVTNLDRTTYLVLDEADRMFDMGFEPQVRSICDHVRPDRQCMLFSATFKKKIERLARDALVDPIKIVQGSIGEASEDVKQIVKVMEPGGFKWNWLTSHLVEFMSTGSVLIFVTKKTNCEELASNLKTKEFDSRLIHGDLLQHERNEIIHGFKKRDFPILVATDVAARGLDIPHIRTVINYDVARDIDTHTHRVGRTGRAGVKGTAYTLVTEKDKEFAGHIVRNLEQANQEVPKELMDLALKSSWFKNSRFKKSKAQGKTVGLGFKEKGFGFGGGGAGGNANTVPIGPAGGGRITAVRQAFKHQFMSNFQRASEELMTNETAAAAAAAAAPTANDPAAIAATMPPPPPPPLQTGGGSPNKKKKSRWD